MERNHQAWWRAGLMLGLTLFFAIIVSFPSLPRRGPPPAAALRAMARVEIANVQAALSDYHSTFGRYPADLNRDITRELLGDNPQKLVFLNARPKQTNTLGELVDPWGTPYRITTTNGVMVYSCGKDQLDDRGEPGTDDLVSWR